MDGKSGEIPQQVLPKGCTEIRSGRKSGVVDKLIEHIKPRPTVESWEKKWGERERQAKGVFNQVIKDVLLGKIPVDGLDTIDSDTNRTHRALLSQGSFDLKQGVLVTIPGNRINVLSDKQDRTFSIGNTLMFAVESQVSNELTRHVEGKFIGIVLNTSTAAAKPSKEKTPRISLKQADDIISSVIMAEKELLKAKTENKLHEYMTQQDIDKALTWVLFGKL